MNHRVRRQTLARRNFLRGAASTILGLPLLDTMLDSRGEALADGSPLPSRYINFFCPTSLSPSGGSMNEGFTPSSVGESFELSYCLQPLGDRGVAADVSAISGLYISPYDDAPGSYLDDYHGYAAACMVTGASTYDWEPRGLSADQIIAQAVGAETLYPSLVYQIDPNRAGQSMSVYKMTDEDRFWYVEAQTSPLAAYRSLFTDFAPDVPAPTDDLEQRLRQSSLSHVADELSALQSRLGSSDRARLEQHLEQVRALELRLESMTSAAAGLGCQVPEFPSEDPPDIGGIPDQDARAELFTDLLQMALACDMTRAVTLCGSDQTTGAGMPNELWQEIGGLHADVQHSSTNDQLNQANRWFVDKYASLLQKLKAVSEGDGTVLDSTVAVFSMEGGKGGRGADGGGDVNHSTDNMILLLGGGAGGLKSGQHIVAQDQHPGVVFNTALQAVGVDAELNEITGHLTELFG